MHWWICDPRATSFCAFIWFSGKVTATHIRFQTDETACRAGPWLCRKCRQQNSSSLDKASRSAGKDKRKKKGDRLNRSIFIQSVSDWCAAAFICVKTESVASSYQDVLVTFWSFFIQWPSNWRKMRRICSAMILFGVIFQAGSIRQIDCCWHFQTPLDVFKLPEQGPNLKSLERSFFFMAISSHLSKMSRENMTLETVSSEWMEITFNVGWYLVSNWPLKLCGEQTQNGINVCSWTTSASVVMRVVKYFGYMTPLCLLMSTLIMFSLKLLISQPSVKLWIERNAALPSALMTSLWGGKTFA